MTTTVTLAEARASAEATIRDTGDRLAEADRRRRQLALDVRLGKAEQADLDAVVAEDRRLVAAIDNASAMLDEIAERERQAAATRRTEILMELDAMLNDLEARRNGALAEIRRAPREASVAVLDRAQVLERQVYAIAADLHRLVGGLTYQGRMQLPLRAVLGEEASRRRPPIGPVTNPGRALLDELAALDAGKDGIS